MRYAVTLLCIALMAASALGADAPAVNKEFSIIDCGTPIELLKLYASTVYRHPDTRKLHLFLEYGNNNGYGIGEEEWEDTDHHLIDVELESGFMRRTRGSDGMEHLQRRARVQQPLRQRGADPQRAEEVGAFSDCRRACAQCRRRCAS